MVLLQTAANQWRRFLIEVVQQAVDATGMTDVPVEDRTKLLSDNGAGYISRAFRDYLKLVRYSPALPIEYFDHVVTDECHRSICHVWRQVLEYYDAFLIGLTATPSEPILPGRWPVGVRVAS
jgi:type I site-specific restriction endonuclease